MFKLTGNLLLKMLQPMSKDVPVQVPHWYSTEGLQTYGKHGPNLPVPEHRCVSMSLAPMLSTCV